MRLARVGVAVSGGGDSTALLHLLADWAREGGPEIAAVTVDHGLREGSAAEAAAVARACAGLGVPHAVLRWEGWDGGGNLQDQARRARLALVSGWARARGLGAVALGHTADDQAETFLMRLARGSGVDGLSGMAPARRAEGVLWLRPLLAARRADLRAFLAARGLDWAEDPSNEDAGFDRVKARRALAALEPLGIGVADLTATAARLALAREVLEATAAALARDACRIEAGDVVIDPARFRAAPRETRLRLLSQALVWVGSAEYRPRLAQAEALLDALDGPGRRTLAGCLVTRGKGGIRVTREYSAVKETVTRPGEVWDGRWRLSGPDSPAGTAGLQVRALAEAGLALCPDWRAAGLPRLTLLASPSVWRGRALVAAPLAGRANGWKAEALCDDRDFFGLIPALNPPP